MKYSVTKDGIPLDRSLYTFDENTKIFSSKEEGLVLDFSGIYGCVFKTGSNCVFKTGDDCVFYTYSNCSFKTGFNCFFYTGSNCSFDTGYSCVLNTGYDCSFKTGNNCSFHTGYDCTFDTGSYCNFDTGYDCTFYTGNCCTFDTGYDCSFHTGDECVLVRRDIYEIIEIPANTTIKLNKYFVKGFTFLEKNEKEYIEIQGYKIDLDRAKELLLIKE